MIRFPLEDKRTQNTLAMVAKTHKEDNLNIKPELYNLWLDSLCETVKKHDPEFTSGLEALWTEHMQEAINIILAEY